MAFLFEDLCY